MTRVIIGASFGMHPFDWCANSMNIKRPVHILPSRFNVSFCHQPPAIMNLLYIIIGLFTIHHVLATSPGGIKSTFMDAADEGNLSKVRELYNDPAIDHNTYAKALRYSYRYTIFGIHGGSTFRFLLSNANFDDLQEALRLFTIRYAEPGDGYEEQRRENTDRNFRSAVASASGAIRMGRREGRVLQSKPEEGMEGQKLAT